MNDNDVKITLNTRFKNVDNVYDKILTSNRGLMGGIPLFDALESAVNKDMPFTLLAIGLTLILVNKIKEDAYER
ncbi:MAG: hypothetical protein AMQ22_01079 [Candidatus Methanofastidiosum methylothiophilum]|uniref:Uncharacterized protein n=1 Tax=Candidatus Methanofastidiosum methylothiophilum TaxID=1705564 RepID=A0A150J4Q8_9EURY|nr:MAG: hypothetical protein AMQ22_01079 [Candidatus Methanofastidiosum methylthiophilus]